jgi:hypothetical protein
MENVNDMVEQAARIMYRAKVHNTKVSGLVMDVLVLRMLDSMPTELEAMYTKATAKNASATALEKAIEAANGAYSDLGVVKQRKGLDKAIKANAELHETAKAEHKEAQAELEKSERVSFGKTEFFAESRNLSQTLMNRRRRLLTPKEKEAKEAEKEAAKVKRDQELKQKLIDSGELVELETSDCSFESLLFAAIEAAIASGIKLEKFNRLSADTYKAIQS